MKADKTIAVAERLLFAHRRLWLVAFALISVGLLWQASQLRPDVSLQKMIPTGHPYVRNYLQYEPELRPLSNVIRIAVEAREGDIYSASYLKVLQAASDEVFYVPGVDRGNLRSLVTANTLWFEASEDGMRSGRVVPPDLAADPAGFETLRDNVLKARLVGELVANDHRSSLIYVPMLELDPETGERLDYAQFSRRLEERIRRKFEPQGVNVHIVGFAKLVGDLIEGARDVGLFFVVTILLTTALVQVYSRCWRSTLATIGCCLLAVVWHLGVMHLLDLGLDPYSILVPFLTFAIGVSHAMQNVNTLASESLAGATREMAARTTFRLLFIPGTVALLCNVVGFSTLWMIDIAVIRELALSASVGVGVIIFTKMCLLPIVMSYAGLSPGGLAMARKRAEGRHRAARFIASLAGRKRAAGIAALAIAVGGWGWFVSRDLQIGDLDTGAPELREDSVYNRDSAWFSAHYATSADVFVVMVKSVPGECGSYAVWSTVERLQWALEETEGVQSTFSLFDVKRRIISGSYGGNLKWGAVTRNRFISNAAHKGVPQSMYNNDCSMLPVIAYLNDHKAATLARVARTVEAFSAAEPHEHAQLLLAAGNAGIEAATNEVVHKAWLPMLGMVYGIVALLLLLEFRSIKAMLCVLLPLIVSSVLCEAVMVKLGLGVKVATLPVIVLGVGIGVDYGIYLYHRLEGFLADGLDLGEAYFETMRTTGLAVLFTGVTLSAGVLTWVASDIKFQSDMGLLLTFMFLWNMLGAVLAIPSLAALLHIGRRRHSRARPAAPALVADPTQA